jgi:hypothetical protein
VNATHEDNRSKIRHPSAGLLAGVTILAIIAGWFALLALAPD